MAMVENAFLFLFLLYSLFPVTIMANHSLFTLTHIKYHTGENGAEERQPHLPDQTPAYCLEACTRVMAFVSFSCPIY